MVTGWGLASDPGSFYALSLSPGQAPRQFFTSETFDLTDLADLDRDGLTELVGRRVLGEEWGRCFTSYVPFTVYRLPSDREGQAERSLPLSESYTRAHYYGWVGPDPSEDWTVVLCAPGGPKIMKRADAERLFNK